ESAGSAVSLISPCSNSSCSGYNVANAVNQAVAITVPGDVIVLEQQTNVCGQSNSGPLGPIEYHQAEFDAIQAATAAGRIVVEAAGNGGQNLDAAACL